MVTLEKDISRGRAHERCAQSLLEVIPDQNAERGGNSLCYFKMTNKKKEGGETNKFLAAISVSFSVSFLS